MSSNHHTPLVDGPAAVLNAALFEGPLGELDAAIDSEVAAVRGETLSRLAGSGNVESLGLVNVMHPSYGAVGDGSTDDEAAFQAAWSAVSAGGTLQIPPGVYAVSDTVRFTNKPNVKINAENAEIRTRSGANFAGKALVDLAGCEYMAVNGLRVNSNLATNRPAAGIVLGRVDAGDGGSLLFENVNVSGSYTIASVYDVGAELVTWLHCRLHADTALPCYYTSSTDDANLVAQTGVSNVQKRFYGCTFVNYSNAAGQKLIVARGVTKEMIIRDTYFALSASGYGIALEGSNASMYGLVIENCRFEGIDAAGARMLYVGQDNPCACATIGPFYWSIVSDYAIECASSAFRNSVINGLYDLAGSTKLMRVSADLVYNVIIGRGSGMIMIDSGKAAVANKLTWFSSASPFAGLGASDYFLRQDNIVERLADYDSEIGFAARRIEGGQFSSGTTLDVRGYEMLELNYGSPATVTNLTNGVRGQTLILIALTGNATIGHGSTIKLAGGSNWTMPTGATLTLLYNGHNSTWYEVGRMSPS